MPYCFGPSLLEVNARNLFMSPDHLIAIFNISNVSIVLNDLEKTMKKVLLGSK